ncbi:MAG: putative porin [bacterium]
MRKLVLALIGMALLSPAVMASNWWETVKVKGDLRYRHEMLKLENNDAARHRQRIRARVGVFGQVNDFTKVGIQLATGGDNPVSTNQTLDDAFSTKTVGVDLAYFETSHKTVPGLTLTGGKFTNPFFKPGGSELLWDSDWNPEGGALNYTRSYDNATVTLIGSGLWIDERSSGDDSYLAAAQGIFKYHLEDKKTAFAIGGGVFNYVNSKDFSPFFNGKRMGNSVVDMVVVNDQGDTTGVYDVYANDYELLEVFGEVTHTFDEIPVTVMADFVTNSAADSLNAGWLVGLKAGKANKPGSWSFRYIYRNLEADAVLGTFTDSDFREGGTDAKGHEIGGEYQLADNMTFGLTFFDNTIGLKGDGEKFNRLQVDLQLKF